ncbi:MAG: helix-turn-helix transcriptional regulator, partial [Hafnia sp.]
MNLAERLKLARKLAGISQKKLGEIIGVSQAAIQKIETGLAQNSTKLIDIAVALNVRPEWLASGMEPMSSNLPIINRDESSIPPQSQWRGVDVWDNDTPLGDDEVE